MNLTLSKKQADKLADFFLDIAKGLIIVAFGILTTSITEGVKLFMLIFIGTITSISIKIAMDLSR